MNGISVLVVDDEFKICEALSAYLKSKNYIVYTAENGREGFEIFKEKGADFIILDLMLPDISGEELCAKIRKISDVPIIMLTAKVQEEDILRGLNLGADDYVTKPFSLKQLQARMEAVLRRAPARRKLSYNGGDLIVDTEAMEVRKNGVLIALTASEWKILAALIEKPNTVFSREKLIETVFSDDFDSFDRVIDTHIKNLRKKIETDSKVPQYILTVRGSGYKFGGGNET